MTEVRHGYTLHDLDRIAAAACRYDRSLASDAHTRYTVAWSAIALHLCTADEPPERYALIEAGWKAIYAEVREMRHTFGQTRDDPNAPVGSQPRAAQYWWVPPAEPEYGLVERLAVHQVMADLKPIFREAIVALAVHDDYALAADSLGIKYGAFGWRVNEARKLIRQRWYAPETAPPTTGTDRRVGSHGKPLRTHCSNGHELTGDNVYRRPNPKPGKRGERTCRLCEKARSKARQAAKRAAA
jgi:hypothetical protein